MEAITRRIYRNNRPTKIARVVNSLLMRVFGLGLSSTFAALEIVGRKSGRVISFPVVVAPVDGARYVVSMLGDHAQWVQNLRAAGYQATLRSGASTSVYLEEIPVDQRAPLIKAYLCYAPGARPHIPVDMDAPIEEFQAIASAYPVFRIVPVST